MTKNNKYNHKYDSDIAPITSSVLNQLIDNSFNEVDFVKEPQFKYLTIESKDRLLKDLKQFKAEILRISPSPIDDEGRNFILASITNQIQLFRNKNSINDQKWIEYKEIINSKYQIASLLQGESLNLNGFTSLTETLSKNKDEVKTMLETTQPLTLPILLKGRSSMGDFLSGLLRTEMREVTLNEAIDKGISVLSPVVGELKDPSVAFNTGLRTSVIPLYFMYKGLVRMYDTLAFRENIAMAPQGDINLHRLMIARELIAFMVLGAPVIVGTLYIIKNTSTPRIDLTYKSSTEDLLRETNKDPVIASSFLAFITKRIPNWLKPFILFIISIICINFILTNTGLNENKDFISIVTSNIVLVKLFVIFGSISSFSMICYYMLSLYLYIKLSKKEISIPIYLPQFILNWLNLLQEMAKSENKGIWIEFYLRLMLVYTLIFLLTLFCLYLLAFSTFS